MAQQFPALEAKHIDFIREQHIFFVGTAGSEGYINVSPKGMDTFRVIGPSQVAWLNLTGSGNESAAHVLENGRMTIMFCSFGKQPLIMRLYGQASVVHGHDERLVVNSVVSSTLLAAIADARDARHAETLTGFKWLSRPAMEHPEWTQVLAYEEALGYAIGAEVRDKDGISAGLAVASMASAAHLRDRTLLEDLDDLHRRHGVHLVSNFSIRDESPGAAERRATIVARLSESPPERIGGVGVTDVAMLAHDVVRVTLEDTLRVVIRPSGTEPKLKCYCEAVEPVPEHDVREARDRAAARIAAIRPALVELVARPEAPSHV